MMLSAARGTWAICATSATSSRSRSLGTWAWIAPTVLSARACHVITPSCGSASTCAPACELQNKLIFTSQSSLTLCLFWYLPQLCRIYISPKTFMTIGTFISEILHCSTLLFFLRLFSFNIIFYKIIRNFVRE